jgi:predicted dehydrogenase/threonine dehydrogenase-like Zn-dependent dehydrogenase
MKQIIQQMNDGKTVVEEVPVPVVRVRTALIKTSASLVSAGTERMLVDFAEKSLIGKAASRPDLVRQVISKAEREGLLPTLEAAFNKLDQPMPLGYSSAGTIIEVGTEMGEFKPGDRVACAGGGFAVHAEYALVPYNLLARLPDNVDFDSAAFTTLGAIAMHGFRLSSPQIGETVCVIGLGLLGLLAAQIARAAGCSVFGIDLSPDRVRLAQSIGFSASLNEASLELVPGVTNGRGFDHVLICADTHSNDTVALAGQVARDRGSVVAVGAVGLDLPRKLYYDKELNFKVSRSYGPGRYDPRYEEAGADYPIGFVRWTEGRNLQSFVDLLASGQVDVHPLITHRFSVADAPKAYELITGRMKEPFLGVLLTYPDSTGINNVNHKVAIQTSVSASRSIIKLGVLGAGNYAQAVFLPIIRKSGGAELKSIVTASGLSAQQAAKKFGFASAATTEADALEDPEINSVAILTRHQHHARQLLTALRNQKTVYCEKPLALNEEELIEIETMLRQPETPILTVGYNRRFAPMASRMAEFLRVRSEPLFIQYRVNAGFLPPTHWLHDPTQGGGRIIGEGCHFIDFLTFLVGESPLSVHAAGLPDKEKYNRDNVLITLHYPDGSIGTVTYLANGNKNYAKERVEVFTSGRIAVLSDFRTLELVTEEHKSVMRSRLRQDKGHARAWQAFLTAVKQGDAPPIPYDQLISTARATFAAVESLRSGQQIDL